MRRARSLSLAGLLAALVLGPLVAAPHAVAADGGGREPALSPVRATFVVGDSEAHGRVISRDAGCKKRVSVHLFGSGQGGVVYGTSFLTDKQGRWSTNDAMRRFAQRGVAPTKVFVVVPGETGCRAAQSPSAPLPSRQAGRAGRAGRTVTLDFRQQGLEGRVTSPRASCEKGVDVAFFFRQTKTAPWSFGDTDTTNGQGRYRYEFAAPARAAGQPIVTVAIGDKRCSVAQSPAVNVPLD